MVTTMDDDDSNYADGDFNYFVDYNDDDTWSY